MYAARLGIGAILIFAAIGFALINRGVKGGEYREKMYRVVAQVDGYDKAPEYYQGLVDTAHEQAFLDNYHMRAPSRRGGGGDKSYLDEVQYIDDIFHAMIQAAKDDSAPHVATALTKYYDAAINPPPPPEPRKNRTSR